MDALAGGREKRWMHWLVEEKMIKKKRLDQDISLN